MVKADVYQSVTDRILAALEAGTVPWRRPWVGGGPTNMQGRPYRGVNIFLLGLMPYVDPRWGTFKAMKEVAVAKARSEGRQVIEKQKYVKGRLKVDYFEIIDGREEWFRGGVRRGEHSTPIILWKPVKRKNLPQQQEGEQALDDTYLLLKSYAVFNAEQCDEMPERVTEFEHVPVEAAEAIVAGYVGPTISVNRVDMAAYSETLDLVTMPPTSSFLSSEGYYSTLFHELVHSTGHKDRLNRLESGGFGTSPYAKEELVAEMGAAMLCGVAGLENLDQSAAYIDGWRERLGQDPKLVVQAAAQAQKGADLILGTTFEDSQPTENREEVAA